MICNTKEWRAWHISVESVEKPLVYNAALAAALGGVHVKYEERRGETGDP